ncbi:MAG: hypothetical protein LBH85_06670 [Treponema sp.]|nr:hypothetical protein [Treponema sp.]
MKNMTKKGLLALVLASALAGGVFAREGDEKPAAGKHQSFDMLIGLNFGVGVTPNMGDLYSSISDGRIPKGNYAMIYDFGLTYDFYLFNWLSLNTGLLFHPDIYLILNQDLRDSDNFTDIAASPVCLTIPLAAHVNVPKVEWLYAGIGLNLNFPIAGMFDGLAGIDTKGDFFVGLPIDIGFDFVRPGRGGGRFFVRITPEFHEKGSVAPIGFIWQIYNWKIYSK